MRYETLYEAEFAARYAARISERSARAWQKLSTLLAFIEILGGSAAMAAYVANNAELSAATGLVLALCVAIQHTLSPAEKAMIERQFFSRFMALLSDRTLTLDDLNQRLATLCSEPDFAFEALRNPAYNDVAREKGRDEALIPLSWLQKTVAIIG
jgi:hypothetical protein